MGRALTCALNACTVPIDWVNCHGSRCAALVVNHRRMVAQLDRVLVSLARHLETDPDESLARRMDFPDRWHPFFHKSMSLLDVYGYPIDHFDFHRGQLSLEIPPPS